jgi:catechol 2,3-dioxygenase-like lactoylglutathione lyase family enzyme
MVLGTSEAIAFVPSTDLERSEAFYAGSLGLEVLDRGPYALVLRAGTSSTMVRITKVDELQVQSFTVFGWRVDDIGATIRDLRDAGIAMERFEGMPQDERDVWTTPNGDQVAWFKDPDGNTLSITRFAERE